MVIIIALDVMLGWRAKQAVGKILQGAVIKKFQHPLRK
jgi:hypothetical protein